jgi:F420-dependent oxidoreductase-like protein
MRLALSIPELKVSDVGRLGERLREVAQAAEQSGFVSLAPMDHPFQIPLEGPPEDPMLESYTLLGFLAGATRTIRLGTMVTGVVYRHPGLLAKILTTLDVVSGGRAFCGIGAAWNERESLSLGIPFPPLRERFERLEETLQILQRMWTGDESPYAGAHYQLDRPLNSPQALQRPHPPILIGGGGERRTLRLVARCADACNLFPSPELPHKLDVLRGHCEDVGRDYGDIERTSMWGVRAADDRALRGVVDSLRWLAGLGIQTVFMRLPDLYDPEAVRRAGETLVSQVAEL